MRTLLTFFMLIFSNLIYATDNQHIFSMGVNGSLGMSNGHIEANKAMQNYFELTAKNTHTKALLPGLGVDFYFGKYLAVSSGVTYLQTGQLTPQTSVYFDNSEFPHNFRSYALLHYLAAPVFIKGGIHTLKYSVFARGGLIPCILTNKDVRWVIDDRNVDPGILMPNVYVKRYDFLCSIGVECGMHFGINGFFITGDYNKGLTSFAKGIDGSAKNKIISFGIKYSRMVIK